MTKPKVAICIPTFNQADFLALSIESALKQTYSEIEILVADDCSTDNTPEIMKEIVAKHPNVKYHRQDTNQGIAKNTNWLINNTEAPYIIRFDSDNILQPTFIEKMVQALEDNPQAAYAHCAVEDIDAAGRFIKNNRLARRTGYISPDQALKESLYGMKLTCFIILFRAVALKAVGFSPDLIYAEDYDVTIRLAYHGWGNVYLNEFLAQYRYWEDEEGTRPRRKWKELTDLVKIHDNFEKIFAEKGWDVNLVKREREAKAIDHSPSVGWKCFNDQDRSKICELLLKLSNTPSVIRRIKLVKIGLGPVFEIKAQLLRKTKNFIKSVLYR